MWNSNAGQPGGLEFEVMDMLYRLPFRDWLELERGPQPKAAPSDAAADIAEARVQRGGRVAARYAAAARKAAPKRVRPAA